MLTHPTLTQLYALGLHGMAKAFADIEAGGDAASLGVVDAVATEGAVTAAAVDLLRPLDGKDPGTLGAIKQAMFGAAARALTADDAEPQT